MRKPKSWVAAVATALVVAGLAGPVSAAGPAKVQVVDFTEYACPPGITTPAELDTAGGPDEVCAVAGKVGEFSWLPEGFAWRIDPVEFDLQASLKPRGRPRSNPEPMAGGSCSPSTLTCGAFQAYGWESVPTGKTTLTEVTLPTGYAFGWASVTVNGEPRDSAVSTSSRTVTFTTTRADQDGQIYIQLINVAP